MSANESSIPTVSLANNELANFPLYRRLGFPREATFKSIVLTPQVAGVWLDLSKVQATGSAKDIYPAVRNIARMIDEDCRQMGLVVPVVVAIQCPPALDPEMRNKWKQMDADTDLNSGEFLVRLLSSPTDESRADDILSAEFRQTILGEFSPKDLINPVRPRSDTDYRKALRESSPQSRTEMHTYLLSKCIEPNWETPEKLGPMLKDLAANLAGPTDSSNEIAST
jgi:hypothetical protein